MEALACLKDSLNLKGTFNDWRQEATEAAPVRYVTAWFLLGAQIICGLVGTRTLSGLVSDLFYIRTDSDQPHVSHNTCFHQNSG